jgi:predicted oxidoreductase
MHECASVRACLTAPARSSCNPAQAFDDCTTLAATFKLLESFEGLLERDAIAAELAAKHLTMVNAFADDIKEVQDIFQAHREFPQLSKNSPPHSGALCSGSQGPQLAVRLSWLQSATANF